jgi:threonine dehydrogenase-like Zn-dependent dehydrogenase
MQAVVCNNFNVSNVENIQTPSPDADEVLLEIQRVQLSVTECNLYRGNEITHYEAVKARIEDGDARLFGHEFCGIIVKTGVGVEEFEVGDRVYASGKIPCGECQFCSRGYELHCPNKEYIGYDRPGALAEYLAVPTQPLTKVPEGVSDAEVASMQPLASTVLCIRDADIQTGDIVAVVGSGVMGHQAGQLALIEGAKKVFAIDIDPVKLTIAEENGLIPINAHNQDPESVITEQTDDIGADAVIEAVGGDQDVVTAGDDPLAQAFRMVRTGGTLVQIGHLIGDLSLRPREIRSKSVDWIHPTMGAGYLGPNTHSGTYAAELVAQDRVSIEEYVTHELEGLKSFEELVDITLNKDKYDALGPAQIVL